MVENEEESGNSLNTPKPPLPTFADLQNPLRNGKT